MALEMNGRGCDSTAGDVIGKSGRVIEMCQSVLKQELFLYYISSLQLEEVCDGMKLAVYPPRQQSDFQSVLSCYLCCLNPLGGSPFFIINARRLRR